MRQISATVTVGSRYGIRSSVRMTFCARLIRWTYSAMMKPISISKMTASRVNLTVFQIALRKYAVDSSLT